MLKAELYEIIANGENTRVEFKRDTIRPEQFARELVAFLNTAGGMLILGLENNGTISGLARKNCEEWVMQVISQKIHPTILPSYEEIVLETGLRVAVIRVSQGDAKPYVLRHNSAEDIFVRMGSITKRATREQAMRLYEAGGMLHAEALPVARTSIESLDSVRIVNYFQQVLGEDATSTRTNYNRSNTDWQERLAALGILHTAKGMCTIAGMLLFGKKPRQRVPQAGLRIFAFNSSNKEYSALLDTILDAPLLARVDTANGVRQIIDEGLVEKCMHILDPFIAEELAELADNIRREKVYHYAPQAIRELVINALVHRDWTRQVDIEIGVYSDRLEVISPGKLHNSMTVEKMLAGLRHSRNSIITEIMRDYGYIDFRGMGVRTKVIPLTTEYSGKPPIFEATDDYLKVTLPKRPARKIL